MRVARAAVRPRRGRMRVGAGDGASLPGLLADLRAHRALTVGQCNQYDVYAMILLNTLQGPTANPAIRQAIP